MSARVTWRSDPRRDFLLNRLRRDEVSLSKRKLTKQLATQPSKTKQRTLRSRLYRLLPRRPTTCLPFHLSYITAAIIAVCDPAVCDPLRNVILPASVFAHRQASRCTISPTTNNNQIRHVFHPLLSVSRDYCAIDNPFRLNRASYCFNRPRLIASASAPPPAIHHIHINAHFKSLALNQDLTVLALRRRIKSI